EKKTELVSLPGASGVVSFSSNGKILATGGSSETAEEVKLWDADSLKLQTSLKTTGKFTYSVAFSPDGKTLASGHQDGTIIVWEVSTGKERARLKGHAHVVFGLGVSADGRILASGGPDT